MMKLVNDTVQTDITAIIYLPWHFVTALYSPLQRGDRL